jgi:hypothetical protein
MNRPAIRTVCAGALLLAALAGCSDRKPEAPKMAEVFPNLPLPPRASFVSRQAGEDALQLTVMAPMRRPAVEAYYRDALSRNGWRLVNTAQDAEGALVLLAERDGPPLWVKITAADDTAWSLVEFSGARTARGSKPAS